MGKWSQKAAIAPSVALNVSPWTITGAGSRAASCLVEEGKGECGEFVQRAGSTVDGKGCICR